MASAMPVLPEVGSRMVRSRVRSPDASATSIIFFAMRSFVEPVGLLPSSFAQRRTPGWGDMRGMPTSGVFPIASRTSSNSTQGLSQPLPEVPPVAEFLRWIPARPVVETAGRLVAGVGVEPHLLMPLRASELDEPVEKGSSYAFAAPFGGHVDLLHEHHPTAFRPKQLVAVRPSD